jgi:CelD/BcsL family acetyltransferase involved in cellulose biosynthesis
MGLAVGSAGLSGGSIEPAEFVQVGPDVGLESLAEPWRALWDRVPDATPFQAPAWLMPWSTHYAPGRTFAVASADAAGLRALAVAFEWRGSVLLAGTGPSDFGDALVRPDAAADGDGLLAALALAAHSVGARRLELRQLRPTSALLSARAPDGWRDSRSPDEPCAVAVLAGPEGVEAVSPRWRANARRAERRWHAAGAAHLPADALAEAPHAVLGRLHAQRWHARGEDGVLADPRLAAFVRDALPRLAADGLGGVETLTVGGRAVAAALVLEGPGAAYYFLGGFDPAYGRESPGLVTVVAAMRRARARGAEAFHFLRGREDYKYRLGAQDLVTWRRDLEFPSMPRAVPAGSRPADGAPGGERS